MGPRLTSIIADSFFFQLLWVVMGMDLILLNNKSFYSLVNKSVSSFYSTIIPQSGICFFPNNGKLYFTGNQKRVNN